MKQTSIDALINISIILGVIAGIPLGFGLLICLVMPNIIYPTIDYDISQDWIHADVTGGSPINPFTIISFVIILIAGSIGIYLESKRSHETKIEDKK